MSCPPGQSVGSSKHTERLEEELEEEMAAERAERLPPAMRMSQSLMSEEEVEDEETQERRRSVTAFIVMSFMTHQPLIVVIVNSLTFTCC